MSELSRALGLAYQQAERDLENLQRARRDRLSGLDRLEIARTGPVRLTVNEWLKACQ